MTTIRPFTCDDLFRFNNVYVLYVQILVGGEDDNAQKLNLAAVPSPTYPIYIIRDGKVMNSLFNKLQ